jgi:hypothetical protein
MQSVDPMKLMWASLWGIGLMVAASLLITFARLKLRGWIKMLFIIVAFFMLLLGFILGMGAIILGGSHD